MVLEDDRHEVTGGVVVDHIDLARSGADQAAHQPQEGRLTAPGGSDDAEELPVAHLEVEGTEGLDLALAGRVQALQALSDDPGGAGGSRPVSPLGGGRVYLAHRGFTLAHRLTHSLSNEC